MSSTLNTFLLKNSTACVLQLCIGKVTTIELRNDTYVTGLVVEADGFMNVSMKDVIFCNQMRRKIRFSNLFIARRLIRFIQIPVDIDIRDQLKTMFDRKPKDSRIKLSGGRRKIMNIRDKRREEDKANAIKLKKEMDEAREAKLHSNN